MTPSELARADHACVWHPFTPQARWTTVDPLIVERAEGAWLIDVHGERYLDGVSSLWTNVHGHRHPRLDAALRAQIDKVAHTTLLGLASPPSIELAAALVDRSPEGLRRVFYSDNGSTAAEIAVKMAYQYHQQTGAPERRRFAGLMGGYHGDTLGAVSVGGIDLFHGLFRPLLFDALALPAPTTPGGEEEERCRAEALRLLELHGSELAALIVEPLVQGAAGMKMHTAQGYLQPVLDRARELGVLLIADEVAVGFGRLGSLFAMEQVGRSPDLLCIAKGLSGGYLPLAATLATERIYEAFLGAPEESRQLFHGHTYTGNPLACAVALASLHTLEQEETLAQVGRIAARLKGRRADLLDLPGVTAVRQRGVMVGIDLTAPAGRPDTGHAVAMACRPRGAILRPLGDTLILNPPLCISTAETDQLVDIALAAIDEVCR